jgi:hypothetical protein
LFAKRILIFEKEKEVFSPREKGVLRCFYSDSRKTVMLLLQRLLRFSCVTFALLPLGVAQEYDEGGRGHSYGDQTGGGYGGGDYAEDNLYHDYAAKKEAAAQG